MAIIWDARKEKANRRKHGVRFAIAALVLDDPYAITITDHESDPNEERFVTIGREPAGRLLVVVYTYRGEDIRIISARYASQHESEQYRSEQ